MKHLFLGGKNELHPCPCQCCCFGAAWPAELTWTVNHIGSGTGQTAQNESYMLMKKKLLIFEMFSHWMNQQANNKSNQDSLLCVSVCVTHASLTGSATRSSSNTALETAPRAIITRCVWVYIKILNTLLVIMEHSTGGSLCSFKLKLCLDNLSL